MNEVLHDYTVGEFYDEMFDRQKAIRPGYRGLQDNMSLFSPSELHRRKQAVERTLFHMGITFSLYGNEGELERILPFDIIPRVIEAKVWKRLDQGLRQRTEALNLFIQDVYHDQKIINDGVVPRHVIETSPGYLPQCHGLHPPHGIWNHISGTDLIRDDAGEFYVLEDNLRCPSGVAYVLENRESMKRAFADLFHSMSVRPVYDYPFHLLDTLRFLSDREQPNVAVLTPGVYNSAYFEHSFLARQMGVELVEGQDLAVVDGYLQMRTISGFKRVDVLYRRIDDTFLDPTVFRPDSMLGIPGLMEVYRQGRVALANAPGTGVADDKVIYAYVPDMIQYYLGEEAIIPNVPTYICERDADRDFVLTNIEKLVVKAANEAGGYGMLIGPHATKAECEDFKLKIQANPRNYIAQPTLALSRVPTLIDAERLEGRHVDLRPFVLNGESIYVMPGGLTRVALKKGSLVVNSSQGGGSKDTWVLSG